MKQFQICRRTDGFVEGMADSEDSEVDVCTVDDQNAAKNMHPELTLVAAKLFLLDGTNKGEEGTLFLTHSYIVSR